MRYSSYGVPFGIPPGDVDGDGDVGGDDHDNFPGNYQVRADYNLDGVLDELDQSVTIAEQGRNLGRGELSLIGNRRGYCGYEHDGVIDTLAHVRHRALMTELGRWSRRDPLGYVDGMSLYAYSVSSPGTKTDSLGLWPWDGTDPPGWPWFPRPRPDPSYSHPSPGYPPVPIPPGFPPYRWTLGDEIAICNHVQSQQSGGDYGGVICVENRKIGCAWLPGDFGMRPGATTVMGCVREHERDHFDDVDCNNCPPGFICRPGWTPEKNNRARARLAECSAYLREIQCYDEGIASCGTFSECRDTIEEFRNDACNQAEDNCGYRPPECSSPDTFLALMPAWRKDHASSRRHLCGGD